MVHLMPKLASQERHHKDAADHQDTNEQGLHACVSCAGDASAALVGPRNALKSSQYHRPRSIQNKALEVDSERLLIDFNQGLC